MEFSNYQHDPDIYDEMFQPDGKPHAHCRSLYDTLCQLTPQEMQAIQTGALNSFSTRGISFTVYGDNKQDEHIIPIDCIPRILSAAEWQHIEAGLTQRLKALNHFLQDIYSTARIISEGVIPADLVEDCPQFQPAMRGITVPHGTWVSVCGTDLVRTNDGFFVLEDNLRVPSGVSYMIANRKVVKASYPRLYRSSGVSGVEDYGKMLRETLTELAPEQDDAPNIVVLTPGSFNSAYYEHMFLAREIGAELVEGRDLLVRNDHLYMRTTNGLQRVDVVYRRVDDEFLDPLVFQPDSMLGVSGLMHVFQQGNIAIANAPGTGVADDKSVYTYVPKMIRFYLNEEPILASVDTRLCRHQEDLEYTLDNLDKLVVKMVGESGGYGMLVGPHASSEERNAYAKGMRANPAQYISQPVLALSRAPCLVGEQMEPRHVDLRPFVLHGTSTRIVAGGLCRVALKKGSLVVNSSQGGGCKDIWVMGA